LLLLLALVAVQVVKHSCEVKLLLLTVLQCTGFLLWRLYGKAVMQQVLAG
jgi:hypothetical protein